MKVASRLGMGFLVLVMMSLVATDLLTPRAAEAHACACRDVNDDGVCDVGDVPVNDFEWLGGTAFVDNVHTFLVPAGCSHTLTTSPSGGVRVTARRIVIGGELILTPSGGLGVLFTALRDIVLLPGSHIVSGGANSLSSSLPANIAIARASVGLKAGTTCTLLGTSVRGNPVTGSGLIGLQCGGDVRIEGSELVAAGADIQSLNGRILGAGSAGASAISMLQCDDPAQNPNGNNNGVLDDGDFPCSITFQGVVGGVPVGLGQVANFCSPPNLIQTLNNPLVMVSKGDLDLGHPGPGHVIEGRYKAQLYAEDGDVDVSHATIANALPPVSAPTGAYIEIAANPFTVKRYPPLKETITAPYTGQIDVTGTCFISRQAVRFRGTTVGAAAPIPCLQGTSATSLPAGVAAICDASGNNNNSVDSGDFPCTVVFAGPTAAALAQAQAFCGETPGTPDVAIAKVDSPDPVVAGAELTYTITVQNVSALTAPDVVVTDPLPAGTGFVSCAVSQGSCAENAGTVTATVGTLTPGGSATMTVKVTAPTGNPCGPITNVASVSATGDTNAANDQATAVTQCKQPPDLAITKVDTPDPVRAGDDITYTIVVTNVGETTATGVVVQDTMPAGTTYRSCRSTQGSCSRSGSLVTVNVGTLAPGASATITLVLRAGTGAACGLITNVATVTAPGDTNPTNNTAQADTQCVSPDVAITKLDNPDPVNNGGQLTYTITVQNVSVVTASSVVMTDPVPAGTAFVSCLSSQGSCSFSGGQVRATIGTMNAGATVTVTVVVTAPNVNPCGPITNVASVTATNDVNTANNTATAVTQCNFIIPTPPDVAITKLDTPDPVSQGAQLTYSMSVQNVSTVTANNVTVSDPLPPGTGFVSCVASQGSCTNNAGTVTAALGTLGAGASATITLIVTAPTGNPCGPITNVATVSATGDTNTANNQATAVTQCTVPPPPDVAITKLDTPDPVVQGAQLTYSITVQNVSTTTATNVAVSDPLPPGTGFVSCTPSQGTCVNNAGTVNASIGTLGAGASATLTLIVTAPTGNPCGPITNVATVSATGDSNAANNTATAVTQCTVPSTPDVAITKSDSPDPVNAGGQLTYTMTITNVSTVTATNVAVSDPLPAGTGFVSCTPSQGTCVNNAGTVNASIGTLGAGASATLTLIVTAPTGNPCGPITNVATVSATGDSNAANDQATAVTQCTPQPAAFLIIDEDSIDNGLSWFLQNGTEYFPSATDVNDQISAKGQRLELGYFNANPGTIITLRTGQVGDEGWFAPNFIPTSWVNAGPTADGLRNYVGTPVGTGLGGSSNDSLLDKTPDVRPLRHDGMVGLIGRTVCAVVYDSDISINYDGPPLGVNGNLMGENLGTVAFKVLEVTPVAGTPGYSSSSLPNVKIEILDAGTVCPGSLAVYSGAPIPTSSSVPFDVN